MSDKHYVVVSHDNGSWQEVVALVKPDGSPAEYDGYSRHAAFQMVSGRVGTKEEIVNRTYPFCPRKVLVTSQG